MISAHPSQDRPGWDARKLPLLAELPVSFTPARGADGTALALAPDC